MAAAAATANAHHFSGKPERAPSTHWDTEAVVAHATPCERVEHNERAFLPERDVVLHGRILTECEPAGILHDANDVRARHSS